MNCLPAMPLSQKNGIGTAEAGTYMKSMLSELTKIGEYNRQNIKGIKRQRFCRIKGGR